MNKCENRQRTHIDDKGEENVEGAKKDSSTTIDYNAIGNVDSEGSAVDPNNSHKVSRQQASKTDLNVGNVEYSRTIMRILAEHIGNVYKKIDTGSAGTCKDFFCYEQEMLGCKEEDGEETGRIPCLSKNGETCRIAGSSLAGTTAENVDICNTVTYTSTIAVFTTTTTITTTPTTVTTTTTINTTITEGCVTANVTNNNIPNNARMVNSPPVLTTAVNATAVPLLLDIKETLTNVADGSEIGKYMHTTSALLQSSYKLHSSLELSETVSTTAVTFECPEGINVKSNNNVDSRRPTLNESYQRENLRERTVVGSEPYLSAPDLCHKIPDDGGEIVSGKCHKQQQPNDRKQHMMEYAVNIEHQGSEQQKLKSSQSDNYLSPQTIDDRPAMVSTDLYNKEMTLKHEPSQEVHQYMQEQLCQQMRQQRQIRDSQQQELQQQPISHEQNPHNQQQHSHLHNASNVGQISMRNYQPHTNTPLSHQLHSLHDALRLNHACQEQHSHQQSVDQNRQIKQRQDEQQQQQLMAYIHHTSEENQLQQLQQHQYQHHPQQRCHQVQQQQQYLLISADFKRLSRPTPTSIDDLILDSESLRATHKLGLSPSHVKHENQDDGYETSVGDVLTPNSHGSSTHSVTPQHQMQHAINLIPPSKCDDQLMKIQQLTASDLISQLQQSPQEKTLAQGAVLGLGNNTTDPYTYMDENITTTNSAVSNSSSTGNVGVSPITQDTILNIECGSHRNSDASSASYLSVITNVISQVDEMFNIQQEHQNQQQQQIQEANNELQESIDYNLKMKLPNVAESILREKQGMEQQLASHKHMQQLSHYMPTQPSPFQFNFAETNSMIKQPQKKRGRKKKFPMGDDVVMPPLSMQLMAANNESGVQVRPNGELSTYIANNSGLNINEKAVTALLKAKERKKHDRFNGMTEEEVVKRTLPDHLCDSLDIIIIGINPGLFAAYKGHHYAGPGNHFWKCLFLSGLTQEQMNAEQDYKLLKYGIGFTNMVQRATKGSADLTRKEIKEGSRILLEKLQRFRPKIAVFNGKLIFEVFSGKKDFNFGRQPECVEGTDTFVWVMPSSSARCAQLPRAADKVPFYAALKRFRDYLNGLVPHINESEFVFTEQKIKQGCEQENQKSLVASGTSAASVLLCGHSNGGRLSSKPDDMKIEYNNMSIRTMEEGRNTTMETQHHISAGLNNNSNYFNGICANRTACGEFSTNSNCNGRSSASLANNVGGMIAEGENRSETKCSMSQKLHKLPRIQDGSTEATYIYRTDENVLGHSMTCHSPAPGPPTQPNTGATGSILQQPNDKNIMTGYIEHPPLEKKKRGRPKKVKEHDLIDSTACDRMQIVGQTSNSNDFGNILNLSMMSGTEASTCGNSILGGGVRIGNEKGEAPKKKRGRPKKIKPINDCQRIQNQIKQNKPHAIAIQAPTEIDNSSPQQIRNYKIQQKGNTIYGSKEMQQQQQSSQQIFTTSSPMRSPAINCSYAGITPHTSTQSTPPTHQQHFDKLLDNGSVVMGSPTNLGSAKMEGTSAGSNNANRYYSPKSIAPGMKSNSSENHDRSTVSTPLGMTVNELGNEVPVNTLAPVSINVSHETHLAESPPPSSPNICSVDYEPPSLNSTINNEHDVDMHNQRHKQNTRYLSPVQSADHQSHEHYQHWLPPHHAISLPAQYAHHQHEQCQQQEQQHLQHFENQQQQLHHLHHTTQPLHESTPTTMHGQWLPQPCYDDVVGSNFSNLSPHAQHETQQQQMHHQSLQKTHQHSHLTHHSRLVADISSKSLSGLESLIDQIPSISENDSVSMSPAVGNSAVSAAVENRLQSLQQQQNINARYSAFEMHTERYCVLNNTVSALSESSDPAAGSNNSVNNTLHPANSLYGSNSPNNYSIHHFNSSAASSPVRISPRHHQQQHHHQLQQEHHQLSSHQPCGRKVESPLMLEVVEPSTYMINSASHTNSPADNSVPEDATTTCTPPISSASTSTSHYNSASKTNLHVMGNNNFSVSNLVGSFVTPSNSCGSNSNYVSLSTSSVAAASYHHSNFIAAAALAAAAASSPTNHLPPSTSKAVAAAAHHAAHHHVPHPQMYMDPHAHLPPHMTGVNSMYAPAPTHHHRHLTPHHPASHHHHHHSAYVAAAQHSTANDYGNPYCTPTIHDAAQTSSLHLPSPNYPYGYGNPVAAAAVVAVQSNYSTAMHAHHTQSPESNEAPAPPTPAAVSAAAAAAAASAAVYHNHHTGHHSHPTHPHTHALSMFDRLKPSDISSYAGF